MQTFIGTKTIKAKPMTRSQYHQYSGWELPADENGEDEGMIIENTEEALYITWLPMDVFDKAYRPIDGLTFGQAVESAKAGKKVARQGWNGKEMFAYIVPPASYPAQSGIAKEYFGENALVPYRAYWALKTAQGDIATWAPSGSDTLAEDWVILD